MPPEEDEPMEMKVRREEFSHWTERPENDHHSVRERDSDRAQNRETGWEKSKDKER